MKLRHGLAALTAAALIASLAACAGDPTGPTAEAGSDTIVVGSAAFGESEILAEIYAGALKAQSIPATTKLDIGAREAYIGAVRDGSVDLFPEYTGNLLQYFDPTATATAPDEVVEALKEVLPDALDVLEPAPGQDKDSLNVTSRFAAENHLSSIEDLVAITGLKLAGNPEFKTRAFGLPGMERIYGFQDVSFTSISDGGGPATLKALTSGKVDVADIYSTTPSISQNHLVTLDDPKDLFAAQNVIPLIRADARTSKVDSVLSAVSAQLTTDDLLELNETFAGDDKPSAERVAAHWLKDNGLA
ncbi:osmoprotectant transport system substrate-binding protein [Nocardioides terrae]|uniref:Osmoprotectant transport system substrate-binding protein n=1 Tax=Nocardioides terrae TaxID=574651 RepID=A0A1I1P4F7_9ACTN|nr:ABC transporter substrate-binding protein [Nocardioides terrae]SFD04655.1 osmoprotectant transport system substrate-binding protein [Nocardioides terrae]